MSRYDDDAELDAVHLAWAGPLEPGAPHYYRVQGPRLLLEWDNTQRGANHAHSVWRDPDADFGLDVLAGHRTAAPLSRTPRRGACRGSACRRPARQPTGAPNHLDSRARSRVLVLPDPGDVPVRPEQRSRHAELPADVADAVDAVGPALHGQPAGPVEQQPAAAAHQLVQPTAVNRTSRSRRPTSGWPSPRS